MAETPFTVATADPTSQEACSLSKPLLNQLKHLAEQGKDIAETDQLFECLAELSESDALEALKSFPASSPDDQSQGSLIDHLSEWVHVLIGTWKGLERGRDFGWIKQVGGGRSQRVWCHKNVIDHIMLSNEEMVQFRLHTDTQGKQSAFDVHLLHQQDHSRPEILVFCTNGGHDEGTNHFIPPRLLLMCQEEVDVMQEFNMETQRDGVHECCFVEKIVRVPRPPKAAELAADRLFAGVCFQHEVAQQELHDVVAMKSQLKDTDIKVWKEHTRKTVLTAQVIPELRRRISAEMCTNAFAKMYEMLSSFKLIPAQCNQDKQLNSLHLCEGPGAFVCATNHFLRSHRPELAWSWRASTLNPHFEGNGSEEMIGDDSFINESWAHWHFGADNSGDITVPNNIRSTWLCARAMGPVLLVTADGSVDCSSNPAQQERLVAPLHLCETVCALGALAVGGSFVLKMFTLLEHSSFGLLRLLAVTFEEVTVCKPVMSTAGNSETYIVCLCFRGLDADVLDHLLSHAGREWPRCPDSGAEAALFAREELEGDGWLAGVVRAACFFSRMQAAAIRRNLKLFPSLTTAQQGAIVSARRKVAAEWFRRTGISRLSEDKRVVRTRQCSGGAEANADGRHRPKRKQQEGDLERRRAEDERRQRIRGKQASENHGYRSVESARSQVEANQLSSVIDLNCSGEMVARQHDLNRTDADDGAAKANSGVCTADDDQGKERDGVCTEQDVQERVDWIRAETGDQCRRVLLQATPEERSSWIVTGVCPAEYTQSKVCSEELVLEVLGARREWQGVQPTEVQDVKRDRSHGSSKPSRARSKLSEVIELCSFGGSSVLNMPQHLVIVDLYGGRGGCSDFLLEKCQSKAALAWIMHRADRPAPVPASFQTRAAGVWNILSAADGTALQPDSPEHYRQMVSGLLGDRKGACSLVVGDAVQHFATKSRSREPASVSCAMCQSWAALSLLRQGGNFLCRIEDTLGRCTLGAVSLLSACFRHVAFVKPRSSSPSRGERFLVCLGFHGRAARHVVTATLHIEEALTRAEAARDQGEGRTVVEVVPMRLLLQSGIAQEMLQINELHLQADVACMRRQLHTRRQTRV